MDKQHVKGAAKKAEGAVQDTVGKLVGNERLQAQGKANKAAGAAHQAGGDLKDAGENIKKAFKR